MLRPLAGCKRHTTAIRLLVALPTIGNEPVNDQVQFLRPNEAHWVSNAITR